MGWRPRRDDGVFQEHEIMLQSARDHMEAGLRKAGFD
jgi:hypothetical protein